MLGVTGAFRPRPDARGSWDSKGSGVPRRPWGALNLGSGRLGTAVAVLAATAAFLVPAVIPGPRPSTNGIHESPPHVGATLAERAPCKPIVLHIGGPAWVEDTAF